MQILNLVSGTMAELRLVIAAFSSEGVKSTDRSDWWQDVCSSHGFEFYSENDLSEASIAWQCHPWPNMKLNSQKSFTQTVTQTEFSLNLFPDVAVKEREGFEDDFSPFVSAENSYDNWFEDDPPEDDFNTAELAEMDRFLFHKSGTSVAHDQMLDIDRLAARLNQLKVKALQMDDQSRRRVAAKVGISVARMLS